MENEIIPRPMTSHDHAKGQTRDSNTLTTQQLENSWRCYLTTTTTSTTIANNYRQSDAVRQYVDNTSDSQASWFTSYLRVLMC